MMVGRDGTGVDGSNNSSSIRGMRGISGMGIVTAYGLSLVVQLVRTLVPVVAVVVSVSLLALAVPVGVTLSPALVVVASPVLALVLLALLLLLWLRSVDAGWRTRVDWMLGLVGLSSSPSSASSSPVNSSRPSLYSNTLKYAVSWLPPFLRPSSSHHQPPLHHHQNNQASPTDSSTPLLQSERSSFDRDSLASNDSRATITQQNASLHRIPPKVVFKSLNHALDAHLVALCNALLATTNVNSNNPKKQNSAVSNHKPQQPVRLGRLDSHIVQIHSSSSSSSTSTRIPNPNMHQAQAPPQPPHTASMAAAEYKILTVWRKEVKDILLRREYARLFVEDLVAFVEYMHPTTNPSTLRIEKLATNPHYQGYVPSFSHRLIQELQRAPGGVRSIGVWCLSGVEGFYENLGFVRRREGAMGPWMVWGEDG
ncbi:hypothetical protein BC830DRAFT_1171697 [Chytriomyces sp. MP71]|nr:hypothetical protein BC830DRAFT_1171697 [Chytriomyces sp. MP71]